jgi:hypothetical protein
MKIVSFQKLYILLAIISTTFLTPGASYSDSTFLFPFGANSSSPDFSNLTIRLNDSMIVEFTIFPSTTAVGIDVFCYQKTLNAGINETWKLVMANYIRQNVSYCR